MSLRTEAEILREADALSRKANDLSRSIEATITETQRTYSDNLGAAQTALGSAQGVRAAVANCQAAVTAGKLVEAEGQLNAARTSLDMANEKLTKVTSEPGKALDEWKECRSTIGRFDSILVDLRKTGFGFITTIIGISAYLFGSVAQQGGNTVPTADPLAKLAVYAAITLLILMLFMIDRAHNIWLRKAVERASDLEVKLQYSLTKDLSGQISIGSARWIALSLYLLVIGIVGFFFWAVIGETPELLGVKLRYLVLAVTGLSWVGIVVFRPR